MKIKDIINNIKNSNNNVKNRWNNELEVIIGLYENKNHINYSNIKEKTKILLDLLFKYKKQEYIYQIVDYLLLVVKKEKVEDHNYSLCQIYKLFGNPLEKSFIQDLVAYTFNTNYKVD